MMGILCLAHLPIFGGQILFSRDPAHWNYPARWFLRASILRGDLPWWNPDQGLGFAVLGNPLYGLHYPPNWLFLLAPPTLVASLACWQGFAHLLWGSAGMFLLARRLGGTGLAAAVAGLAWGLAGYTMAAWTAGLLLLAGAWIPWCGVGFVALSGALTGGRAGVARGVASACGPVAMALLLGEPFVAMMGVAFGTATAAAWLYLDHARERPPTARLVAAVAASLALAVGIGAVAIWPARTLAGGTERAAHLPRAVAESASLHPLRLVELVAPGSMGDPAGSYPGGRVIGEPSIDGYPLMHSLYAGAGIVLLASMALGRRRPLSLAIMAFAVVALLVSFGRHTPLHELVRSLVSPLGYMRYPEKYAVLVVAWLALLAALGLDRALAAGPLPWRRSVALPVGLLALAVGAPRVFAADWAVFVRGGCVAGALAAIATLAGLFLTRRRPRLGVVLLLSAIGLDLGAAAWPLLGFRSRAVAVTVPAAAQVVLDDHRRRGGGPAPPRVYRADMVETSIRRFPAGPADHDGEWRSIQTLVTNTANTYGIATMPGYDAAIPPVLTELWRANLGSGVALLRLLGTGYAVLPIQNPGDPVERRSQLEPLMDPAPGARLYRIDGVLPRVYLARRAEIVPDAMARQRLLEPDILSGRAVLLAPAAQARPLTADNGDGAAPGRCTLVSFSNVRLVARCESAHPGTAVFLEQHAVGWRAEVDGRPAPLLRANLLMRAVQLDAGAHTVTLSYTPPALGWSASASLVSLLLLGVALALGRIRSGWHPNSDASGLSIPPRP
jgi:hypothetical protein